MDKSPLYISKEDPLKFSNQEGKNGFPVPFPLICVHIGVNV